MKDSTKAKISCAIVTIVFAISMVFVFAFLMSLRPEWLWGWSAVPYVLGCLLLTALYWLGGAWVFRHYDNNAFYKY